MSKKKKNNKDNNKDIKDNKDHKEKKDIKDNKNTNESKDNKNTKTTKPINNRYNSTNNKSINNSSDNVKIVTSVIVENFPSRQEILDLTTKYIESAKDSSSNNYQTYNKGNSIVIEFENEVIYLQLLNKFNNFLRILHLD